MKSQRLVETATPRSVCLFCLTRQQYRAQPLPLRRLQRRHFATTPQLCKPPAEAVAQQEPDSSQSPAPPQPQKKWGSFLPTAKATGESFPDLDVPKRPAASSKWGAFAAQTPTRPGEKFKDRDIFPVGGLPVGPRRVEARPSPRWDESVRGTSEGDAEGSAYNISSVDSNRREGYAGMRKSNGDTQVRGSRPRYQSLNARDDRKDMSIGQAVGPKQQWGRHLKPTRPIEAAGQNFGLRIRRFEASERPQPSRDEGETARSPKLGDSPYTGRKERLGARDDARERAEGALRNGDTQYVGFRSIPLDFKTSVPPKKDVGYPIRQGIAPHKERIEDRVYPFEWPSDVINEKKEERSPTMKVDELVIPSTIEDRFGKARGKKGSKDKERLADFKAKREKADAPSRREQKFKTDEEEDEPEDLELETRKERKKRRQQEKLAKQAAPSALILELPPFISVANMATALRVRLVDFVERLEELGFEEIATDHVLNFENSSLIAMEYGFEASIDRSDIEDLKARPPVEDTSNLPPRPPIVTIMGHVDHGKTTLLDYLRKSSVAASEHGGITQHIGAFSVQMASGKLVTFLDTPGHAAFLSMRQRGANVTDIVVLVVAADDSVKPQTIEAIKHARSAQVPIIVAINKIDKDEADIQGVKQDLLRHEIEVEDFGGDVQAIPVSGKTGQGLDELEEALVAQAETIDMRAETDGPAEGWVLEATTKAAGRVATVLVRRGTLRPSDVIVAGTTWSRIRTLKNEAGVLVPQAGPGTPVEVDGWRDQPMAGDEVLQAPTEQKATSAVRFRQARIEREQAAKDMEAINETRRLEAERREREKAEKEAAYAASKESPDVTSNEKQASPALQRDAPIATAKASAHSELYFLIKADASGSAEAIEDLLITLPVQNQPVTLHILRTGVGPISEFDVDHVAAVPPGKGFLISFNQPVPAAMAHAAEKAGIRVMDENIIYKVIDNVRTAIEDHLPPLLSRRVLGEAEAAQVFEINIGGRKTTKVCGCRIRNGIVGKGKKVKVYRGGMDDASIVYEGTINSLKSQKKDVQEMRKGTECGMGFEGWEGFETGDMIQCYEEKSEKRRLT